MSYYTCLRIACDPNVGELLIAELSDAGFESFVENDGGIEAYVETDHYDRPRVDAILTRYSVESGISYTFETIEKKNWNEAWEKSYEPIIVDDKCIIRAEFHRPEKHYPYELIITPKMSFGTGHHQTTYLMIRAQLRMDHRDKRVMDAGCGTAILSVMASKLGAKAVEAFDIDEWSITNSDDNIVLNGCRNIRHQQGKLSELQFDGMFDIILANINKNVLLDEMAEYRAYLSPGGKLLLSGFFSSDIPDLLMKAKPLGLVEESRDEKEQWASLLLCMPNDV